MKSLSLEEMSKVEGGANAFICGMLLTLLYTALTSKVANISWIIAALIVYGCVIPGGGGGDGGGDNIP